MVIVTIIRMAVGAAVDEADLLSVDEARANYGANAASYLEVPGLLWKAYLLSDDRRTAGGVYWWADRASAEAKFNDGWREGLTAKYGAPPTIEWFEAPVVVDGRFDVVHVEPPPLKAHRQDGDAESAERS